MVNISSLQNGVRVITERVPHVESVAVGLWVGAGAKNEQPPEYGCTHFIEHMLFKGTGKRSAKEIADAVSNVGGHINAATDKEYTTYYIRVLKEFLPLCMDVLTDMLLGSVFDPEELEREKDVIVDEIRRHDDLPEDRVHDAAAEACWAGHGLGHSVLGTEETVRSRTSDDLKAYLRSKYDPSRIVVSVAGNMEHEQVVDLAAQTLGTIEPADKIEALPDARHNPGLTILDKDTEAAYFCISAPGSKESDDRRFTLAILDAVLGGGMSSRLFQEVREKRGLAYDIGSYRIGYREAGMFTVYGGTGLRTLGEVVRICRSEMRKVMDEPISEEEITRAKAQMRGALLLGQENMGNRMSRMGKSLLDHGRLITVHETIERVSQVTAADVQEVASGLLAEQNLSTAIIGPRADVEKALSEVAA